MNKLEKHLWQIVSSSILQDQRYKFLKIIERQYSTLLGFSENTIFVYLLKNKIISLDHLEIESAFVNPNNVSKNILIQYFSFSLLQSRAFKFLWKGKLENLVARTVANETSVKKMLGMKEWRLHFTRSNECYALHTSGDGFIITKNGLFAFFWDFEKNKFKEPHPAVASTT
jgi:hypothetical protein